jgi:NADH-quinone oxidoreductase subunit C
MQAGLKGELLMNQSLQTAVTAVTEKYKVEATEFRDEVSLVVPPDQIISILQELHDDYSFDLLLDLTAVDYWPAEEPRFHVIYQLYSMSSNQLLRLRVPLIGNAPVIATADKIWPGANWYEREVWDMFGIRFDGSSDMRRIIMPYDWEGYPLRKDYPLGYEEVQFSFNKEEIMTKKPHPEERS